jgi:hypothetical protein
VTSRYLFTIQPEHVHKSYVRHHGKMVHVGGAIGPIQAIDVGKQVFDSDGVIQVENEEQRTRRQLCLICKEPAGDRPLMSLTNLGVVVHLECYEKSDDGTAE